MLSDFSGIVSGGGGDVKPAFVEGPSAVPARKEEAVAEGGAPDAVHGARVPVVGLEILLVVAHGALVDQAVLGAGEVRGSVPGGEVERQPAGLSRDHAAFRVAFDRSETK